MVKHAYLIMCHNNFQLLKKLLILLDDERNDIYLHIDKKSKVFDCQELLSCVKDSSLKLLKRINVNWGGYSQIEAELMLLKEATQKEHSYYHLLSGVDLPLKTQNEIHNFFEENSEKEFVSIDDVTNDDIIERIGKYYFFQDYIGRNIGYRSALLEHLESFSLKIQSVLNIKREALNSMEIFKGTNWFSITHKFAIYLLSKENDIRKNFKFGLCADELFLQTIIMNSAFRNNLVNDSLRYIDWKRGKPYTFTEEDYELLISSNKLFARKFDYNKSPEIIEHIFRELQCRKKIKTK